MWKRLFDRKGITMAKRKSISGLAPRDFEAAVKLLEEKQDQVRSFLHSDCPLIRAAEEHISKAAECVLIDREPNPIVVHKGIGWAIEWEEVFLSFAAPDCFCIHVKVTYFDEGRGGREYTCGDPIWFPLTLVEKFTKKKWNEFLRQQRDEARTHKWEHFVEEFSRLLSSLTPSDRKHFEAAMKKLKMIKERRAK